ncbi:MAG: PilZ domain-containing protein [Candidatus Latescibacteria bacterium]|nr:PilZ domain-containing protein [Candidatus Latescibacterota bacterium]
MSSFLDLFGLKRRREERVKVGWLVDARLRASEQYVGFHACDVSVSGLRLSAALAADFERAIDRGRLGLLLRVPGNAGALEAEAEVRWQRVEEGRALLGCEFRRPSRELRRLLEGYISAHPEDVVAPD